MIIAIDGPAGAGKSTVAQRLARRLGLDAPGHGGHVRALTLRACANTSPDDESWPRGSGADGAGTCREGYRVFMDGEDITSAIRSRRYRSRLPGIFTPHVRSGWWSTTPHGGRWGVVVEGRTWGR